MYTVLGPEYCDTPKSRKGPEWENISFCLFRAQRSMRPARLQSQCTVFTAIIPVHNRADLLERLLDSIARQTVPFAEIVVVDNASTDGAAELARTRGCRVIGMGENVGFARAVNRGWKAAATEWVAILNSDVELDSRWLERLTAGIGDAACATGMILDAANRGAIDGTYDLVSRARMCLEGWTRRAGWTWRAGRTCRASPRRIAIAPGTACIFRRDALDQAQRIRRALWLLSGRRGSRVALSAGGIHGRLCPRRCRLPQRQRHAGPVESASRSADLAESADARRTALRSRVVPILLLAYRSRPAALGARRSAPWKSFGLDSRESRGASILPAGRHAVAGTARVSAGVRERDRSAHQRTSIGDGISG